MSSSTFGFVVSLGATGLYGFSMYYLTGLRVQKGFDEFLPKPLQSYGLFKFLTIQCLVIQLVSSVLHVLAHFVRPLRGVRDFVFTTLAFPVGSIVVYSFWLVWFGMGRELIFPAKLDAIYPPWLNHTTHTIVAPLNILLAVIIYHQYLRNAVLVTLLYMLSYLIYLHMIRAQTGLFVYGYLNHMNDTQRICYFACSAVFAYLMYKMGQFVTRLAHGSERTSTITRKPAPKSSKQR